MGSSWIRRVAFVALGAVPACIFLFVWEVASRTSSRRMFLFGSPSRIASVAFQDTASGRIIPHAIATFEEVVSGLALGTLAGCGVGFGLWLDRRVGKLAAPYVVIIGAVPIFAVAPQLIMWFGVGFAAKVFMSASSVFVVSLVSSNRAACAITSAHGDWLKGIRASRWFTMRHVILPEAFRSTLTLARQNVGFAILGAFIAEFVSSNRGLGYYILRAGGTFDTSRVFFGIAVLAVMALLLSCSVRLLEIAVPALRHSTPQQY